MFRRVHRLGMAEAMANDKEEEMTLIGHLEELRARLIKSVIALASATLLSLLFAPRLLKILIAPAGDIKPIFLRPTEGFVLYMRVAFISGAALAMPIILYQAIRFIIPGLRANERRYLYVILPGAAFFFLLGVAFAYFVMLPVALKYLLKFGSDIAEAKWAIGEYIPFVTNLMFWVGVVFETPMLMFFLAKFGIVTPKMLSGARRYAWLAIAVLAAIITPTADPFNMLLVMAPLLVLYEFGLLLAKLA